MVARGRNQVENELIKSVREHDQGHLLRFWDELDEGGKELLLGDLKSIDYSVLTEAKKLLSSEGAKKERRISPPDVLQLPSSSEEVQKRREAMDTGSSFIRAGKAGVFTAAGGQSSRLGIDIPKGAFPVTPVKHKSLFQAHAEKIYALQKTYGVKIPWILMVSETNRQQTTGFFQSNNYFGLDPGYVRFIQQEMFPAIDQKGRILLREKSRVFLSPSGHGGTFSAIKNSGTLDWMKSMAVEELFYFQVDNVLIKILDPVFIGYHVKNGCSMSSKCVSKRDRAEKLGMFAVEKGSTIIIEYSEIHDPDLIMEKSTIDSYAAGSIAIHMINLSFAERTAKGTASLPLHLAYKTVPFIDERGKKVMPEQSNAYKIETFIFDALKNCPHTMIMEVKREEEFSPLKNKTGEDSPQTVERDQLLYFGRWFEEAGVPVPRDSDGVPLHKLEVSPIYALSQDDFVRKMKRDMVIDRDTYIE
jgi:UDP-N-acetylglucosamine/UDP-N-acetylgalactosamine diphosphorylase